MSATAEDPRGLKRICMSCGVRFYDMNKRPISCPSCDTEFDGEIKVKARRGRLAAVEKEETPKEAEEKVEAKKPVKDEDEDIIEDEDDGVEVISLDDVEEKSKDDDDADDTVLGDDDDALDDIPDLDEDLDDDLDDDTLLDPDDDD